VNSYIKYSMNNLQIRSATSSDIPLILQFIKELADFEKLLHEVTATEERLQDTLFGSKPYAEVIIAEVHGIPAGFALFHYNYSTFLAKPGIYLKNLYVKPQFRGQKIGAILIAYLAKLALERKCGRLEWWVLDWNEQAIGLYKKIGAQAMDEWTVQRVAGNNYKKLIHSHHFSTFTSDFWHETRTLWGNTKKNG
jgi:GNAT superfamily N-acetyltransferase